MGIPFIDKELLLANFMTGVHVDQPVILAHGR